MMKKVSVLLLAVALLVSFGGCKNCEKDTPSTTEATMESVVETQPAQDGEELVILYTNDLHGAYLRDTRRGTLGFAALASYKNQLEQEKSNVILLDGGDAFLGSDSAFKAAGILDIMDHMGYSFAVPGEHEFDFGIDSFLHMAENLDHLQYLCCNIPATDTRDAAIKSYAVVDYSGVKVAYLGIAAPGCDPDATGDVQDFYDTIQGVIDEVKADDVDFVIGLSHLGTNPTESPWTSVEVIKHTTGLNILLDGHSHSAVEDKRISDKDDRSVLLCSGGSQFDGFMDVRLNLGSGVSTSKRITEVPEDDKEILSYVDTLKNQELVFLSQVIGTSEVEMESLDTDGAWQTRLRETALGNFCADAYRLVLGTDVAMVNAGNIRGEILKGDVTLQDVQSVVPFNMESGIAEVTGQEILDALEMAYRMAGEENTGFLQLSGITCQVDTKTPSGVILDADGNFCGVSGQRRVHEVMVNGEPIQPERVYTIASNAYLLKYGGDGFSMLVKDGAFQRSDMTEPQILLSYIQQDLEGVITEDLYGLTGDVKRIDIIK